MGKWQSIAGLVCGIVALAIICWFGSLAFIALPIGVIGIVLSTVGGKKYKQNGIRSSLPIVGLVLSIIATVISGIIVTICGLCVSTGYLLFKDLDQSDYWYNLKSAVCAISWCCP